MVAEPERRWTENGFDRAPLLDGTTGASVDTHVHRVTRRLGLILNKTSREKARQTLEQLLPEELYYTGTSELHRARSNRLPGAQATMRDL